MAPAAKGPPGSSLPLSVLDCSNPSSPFARAIDVIEHELALTQGNVEAVTGACDELRRGRDAWPFASTIHYFVGLARLVTKGSSAAREPLVPLLLDVAEAIDEPWTICAELLDARDRWICDATLERIRLLVESGRLRVDDRLLEGLGKLIEHGPDLLREPAALEKIRELWRGPPGDTGSAESALTALYLASAVPLSRRLAARLLDLPSSPPAHEIATQLLGRPLADYLEPYLAYTRATHLDLLDLAGGSAGAAALLASLQEAEAQCGAALLREIVSTFGWRSLNDGVTVSPFVGLSVGGSFPLLVTPAEATILERCPDVRRVFERFVIVAHAAAACDGETGSSGTGAIDRFRRYNIRHANLLVDLLDIAPLSVETVRRMLEAMAAVVEDFEVLFGSTHGEECAAVAVRYGAIAADIERELAESAPDRPLSASLTRLVQAFEDPSAPGEIHTMHGCKRYLHQRGLQLGSGLAESSRATNRTVTLGLASASEVMHVLRTIEYAEFEPAGDGSIPHVVRAAVDGFARHLLHGQRSFPGLRIFCYGNEVHCFAGFRNHPAFIRLDFSPPQRGGMIDLEYFGVSKYDLEWHPNVSLDAIQQIFRAVDFDVQVVNTRVRARFDKERAADLRDIADQVQRLFNLVPYLMDVDWVIGDLDLSDEAKHTVAASWGEFFVRWGVLPMLHVLTADRRGILVGTERTPAGDSERRWSGDGPYRDRFTVDPPRAFWASLRAALEADGLAEAAPFDGERPIAQSTIDRHLLHPLRLAVARGQLAEADGRLAAASPHLYTARHEASVIAEVLMSDDETLLRSAALARFVLRLAGNLRFSPTGTINGYEVQRALLPLADGVVGLFVLCDGGGIPRLAVFSRGDMLYERRFSAGGEPTPNWSISVESLAADLRRANITEASVESDFRESRPAADLLRAIFMAPNAWARSAPAEGDRYIRGVKASPGRAVGLARPGIAGRQPADLDGGVLVAPALGPHDNPFVFRSAGIVSTGGGVLSHAGLLALQFRKPALVVSGRWERSTDGAESLVYSCVSHREVSRQVGRLDVVERHDTSERDERLRDGDLVVLDADAGLLLVMGQERDALVLHDGLRQLVAAGRSLATAANDEELLSQRGRLLRARYQLEKLLARIGDPALARFAATELLVGESGSDARLGHADKVRLLRALFGNALVGPATVATVGDLAHALARRDAALAEQASQLIPTSADPLEVIAVRLDVRHSRGLLDTVSGLLAEAGVAPPARASTQSDAIDSLAASRLSALRIAHSASLDDVTAGDDVPRHWRHALRQLQRMDDVLNTSAREREHLDRVAARLAAGDAATVRTCSTRCILGPADGGIELWPLVGSKAANLAEAERLGEGALIPRWFVVTDCAFRIMLDLPVKDDASARGTSTGRTLRELIDRTLARRDLSDAQKSLAIGHAWESVPLPETVVAELTRAYRALASWAHEPAAAELVAADSDRPFVAVRSSAREEDLEGAARAGEFDTFLFVRGLDDLCHSLKCAWSGLWTERAIHNRAVLGITGEVGGGILVQQMVWARAAGVLHTINLAEGRMREMVINAGLGLGEGIVSGAVAADQVIVSKPAAGSDSPLRFRYITNDKRERVVFDTGFGSGTARVPTLYHQRLRPALEYVELCEIVGAAARLESAYRKPLDIEFAIEGMKVWLLQVRPVPAAQAAWRETIDRHPFSSKARL